MPLRVASTEGLGAYSVNLHNLSVLLPMEPVHQAVHYRGEDEAGCDQEYEARIQRVDAGKELASISLGRINWPHSAHQHCGVEEGIPPR